MYASGKLPLQISIGDSFISFSCVFDGEDAEEEEEFWRMEEAGV